MNTFLIKSQVTDNGIASVLSTCMIDAMDFAFNHYGDLVSVSSCGNIDVPLPLMVSSFISAPTYLVEEFLLYQRGM